METRNSVIALFRPAKLFPIFCFLFSIFTLIGCGAPGDPTPPSPPVPTAVTDLAARQSGDGVQLRFTMPAKTVSGDRLAEPPAVEILRGSLKPDGAPDKKSFRVVYTLPGALIDIYTTENRLQFTDPIPPQEMQAHPGLTLAYRVQTRASKKRASAESNTVIVKLFPVAQRIASLDALVTESAVELSWPAPTKTSAGAPLSGISAYHVYRGELDPSTAQAASHDITQAKWLAPLTLLAPSPTNGYRDTVFDFGKTYAYTVRSVTIADGTPLESDDSVPAVVAPRDTFPPAPPQNLTASAVPTPSGAPAVDLSWSISLETDLAGYRVYRSEGQDTPGKLLTQDLLSTPAWRDISVLPGHAYWYTVTAVDRAGNESARSASAAADLTQPLP